ncbi:hypothetical protein U1Q18_009804 [Sarracenia purpurea var. burkii]
MPIGSSWGFGYSAGVLVESCCFCWKLFRPAGLLQDLSAGVLVELLFGPAGLFRWSACCAVVLAALFCIVVYFLLYLGA